MYAIAAASGLLAVLLALAWAREFKLRRALQNLLARLFRHWSNTHETDSTIQPCDDERGPADAAGNGRL
jgi:hypothetical protein